MAKKKTVTVALEPGALVALAGGRVGEWVSEAEAGSTHRTEYFRTVDSLGLMLRHGSISAQMHDAGQEFNRTFVFAQLEPVGAAALDRIPGGQWRDSITERSAWARKRLGAALDAVGGIGGPGGCALWHVAGLGKSVKEWAEMAGWNGRAVNVHEAKGILVAALGMLAVHYGYGQKTKCN